MRDKSPRISFIPVDLTQADQEIFEYREVLRSIGCTRSEIAYVDEFCYLMDRYGQFDGTETPMIFEGSRITVSEAAAQAIHKLKHFRRRGKQPRDLFDESIYPLSPVLPDFCYACCSKGRSSRELRFRYIEMTNCDWEGRPLQSFPLAEDCRSFGIENSHIPENVLLCLGCGIQYLDAYYSLCDQEEGDADLEIGQ